MHARALSLPQGERESASLTFQELKAKIEDQAFLLDYY